MDALRGSLVLDEHEEIAHIYKLHLPTPDGRTLMVNVSVAPFQVGSGERLGHHPDPRRRHRARAPRGAAPALREDGLASGCSPRAWPTRSNTPLTGISSYTQMLRGQTPADDPRAALLEKIEKQTFRAAKIINHLLNFSRSGSAEFEALDVNKVVSDVFSLLEHQLDRSRIVVRKELSRGAAAGAGQREPPAAGVLQPDPERARCHARGRLAHPHHRSATATP